MNEGRIATVKVAKSLSDLTKDVHFIFKEKALFGVCFDEHPQAGVHFLQDQGRNAGTLKEVDSEELDDVGMD